jgi:hypothetical protein
LEVPEPRLNTICNPDGFAPELGRRRPTASAFVFSFSNRLQMPTTYEQAQMPNAIKLQVAVDDSDAELSGELLIDHLHDLFQLLVVMRIELADRPQQPVWQDGENDG